jgi:hypothetical protein
MNCHYCGSFLFIQLGTFPQKLIKKWNGRSTSDNQQSLVFYGSHLALFDKQRRFFLLVLCVKVSAFYRNRFSVEDGEGRTEEFNGLFT